MRGKILSFVIVLFLILGCFGVINTSKAEEDCGCENTTNSQTTNENRCGFVRPENWQDNAIFGNIQPSGNLPSSFDWRAEVEGGLPPCKDQGQCGSCWAFATVGPLECNIKIKDNEIVDLSEQWLLSCNKNGYSCAGGWWVHEYHYNTPGYDGGIGAVMEDDFRYQANSGISCGTDGPYNHVYRINGWAYIDEQGGIPSDEEMKQAILDYGPIGVGVYCDSIQWSWHSLTNPDGVYTVDSSSEVNHAVVLVGWDDPGGYWILRNSWGTGFCNQGYMKFAYDICSIGEGATYVDYTGCDLTDKTINGNEYYWSEGDVSAGEDYLILSPGGFSDGAAAYQIMVDNPNNCGIVELWVGIQFKDTSTWPTNDGPDFYVQKNNEEWVTLEEGMGKPSVYTYTWRIQSDPENYVFNDGYVRIKVHAAWDDCTYIQSASIRYNLHKPVPNLECEGSISQTSLKPGAKVSGSFIVMNTGESGSGLDWEITDQPDWGSGWSFTPSDGDSLGSGDTTTVNVEFYVPNEEEKSFSGQIIVTNKENPDDTDSIDVSISTPKSMFFSNSIFLNFLQKLPILRMILSINFRGGFII